MIDVADTITVKPVESIDDIYCRYNGQLNHQPCHVSLDLLSGEVSAGYRPDTGNGISLFEAYGLTITWKIPCLSVNATNDLLERVAEIAKELLGESEIVWDGDRHIGRQTDDGREIRDEIEMLCRTYDDDENCLSGYDPEDWYVDGCSAALQWHDLNVNSTDGDLDEAADETVREAIGSNIIIDHVAVVSYLAGAREEAREILRGELEDVSRELISLRARRNALIIQLDTWGDSRRTIGELAGVSHTAVGKIVRNR